MSKYIYDMIEKGEGLQLDFKFEINEAKKIAKSLVAFANTEGGKLLIGVKDNGKIAGIRTEEEYFMLDAAATLYCKPNVTFSIKKWNIEGRTILEADIPPVKVKPCMALNEDGKWRAYIRVNDKNMQVNSNSDQSMEMKIRKKEYSEIY